MGDTTGLMWVVIIATVTVNINLLLVLFVLERILAAVQRRKP